MNTIHWKVDPQNPDKGIISQAAAIIKNSELVAFPTETVYGLGAAAFFSEAVEKIFAAKGRPAENPLLIHVSNIDQVKQLVTYMPDEASLLMDMFWPGPLSLILPASQEVPSIVRGGKPTVGFRMPSHPVALALINAAGPLAAPSANLSGRPSPTTAEHVKNDLGGRIAAILDGGPTGIGLESTILDLSTGDFKVLRQGGLPVEEIEQVLGTKINKGMVGKHSDYYPNLRIIIKSSEKDFQDQIIKMTTSSIKPVPKMAIVDSRNINRVNLHNIYRKYYLQEKASNLYTILRDAEDQKVEVLLFAPLEPDIAEITISLLERIYNRVEKG